MDSVRKAGRRLARFAICETGATSIEYAMIAVLIGTFVSATVYGVGGNVAKLWDRLAGAGT